MMSRLAIAAAQTVGCPEYVGPWRNHAPSSQKGAATLAPTMTPPSGR